MWMWAQHYRSRLWEMQEELSGPTLESRLLSPHPQRHCKYLWVTLLDNSIFCAQWGDSSSQFCLQLWFYSSYQLSHSSLKCSESFRPYLTPCRHLLAPWSSEKFSHLTFTSNVLGNDTWHHRRNFFLSGWDRGDFFLPQINFLLKYQRPWKVNSNLILAINNLQKLFECL